MTDLPRHVLRNVFHALREAALSDRDALIVVGRLLAWHSIGDRVELPPALAPYTQENWATNTDLQAAFDALARHESLGDVRCAFDRSIAPDYAALAPNTLAAISGSALPMLMLDQPDRQLIADDWEEFWRHQSTRELFDVPPEVADFVVRSLGLAPGESLQCPGYNPDSVAIAAMRAGLRPVIVSTRAPVIAAIYAAIAGRNLSWVCRDPLAPEQSDPTAQSAVQACAAIPPWGRRFDALEKLVVTPSRFGVRSSEALGLELVALSQFQEAAIAVPMGVLFSRGPEVGLRQAIITQGTLVAAISFPSGLLPGTALPFVVLRFSRRHQRKDLVMCRVDEQNHVSGRGKIRSRDRRFTGASNVLRLLELPEGPLAKRVPYSEIAEHDFVLVPDRYFSQPSSLIPDSLTTVPLGELVSIVKPQFLKPDETPEGVEIQEAVPSEMPAFGYLARVERTRGVDAKTFYARDSQILRADDVLLATKGTIGTVAVARPDPSNTVPLLPSQASVILRLKRNAPIRDPRFLVMYLRSPAVQHAIKGLATGGTIQNISLEDLRALPVWVPDDETQARIVTVFDMQAEVQTQIDSLKARQSEAADSLWREMGLSGAA